MLLENGTDVIKEIAEKHNSAEKLDVSSFSLICSSNIIALIAMIYYTYLIP